MKITDEIELFTGKWLVLKRLLFVDKTGNPGAWEYVERKNNTKIVTLVCHEKTTNEYLLIKQYRLPIKQYEISFPSGLVDKGENIEAAALRELKEETGFTATVESIHGPFMKSAGLTTEATYSVHCIIDKIKDKGAPEMESTEEITAFWCSAKHFNELERNLPDNTVISNSVANFFFGLNH